MDGCCGIDRRKREDFLEMILNGDAPTKEELEDFFPAAFMRLENKYGKNYWTLENITDYWRIEHNRLIDNRDAGYEDATVEQAENCKTKSWIVDSSVNGSIVSLRDKIGEKINGYNYRKLNLREGEYVVTHTKWIIEKLSREEVEKYG